MASSSIHSKRDNDVTSQEPYRTEMNAIISRPNIKSIYVGFDDDDEEVADADFIFFTEITPMGWYSLNWVPFKSSKTADQIGSGSLISYQPIKGLDYLCYSFMRLDVPRVAIKREYADRFQFRWAQDLGYVTFPSSRMVIDDVEYDSIEYHGAIFWNECNVPPGFEKCDNKSVGNSKNLTKWKTVHPRVKLTPFQPWFYGRRSETAFPLYRLSSQSVISHEYVFDKNISHFIRLRELRDGEWHDVSQEVVIEEYESIFDGPTHFPKPQLWGCFSNVGNREFKIAQCKRPTEEYFVESIVGRDDISAHYNSTVGFTADLNATSPTKLIWLAAQNKVSTTFGDYTNYTTNVTKPKHGETPISTVSLMYGDKLKFADMPSEFFTGPILRNHVLRPPRRHGLLVIPMTYRPIIGIDLGVMLDDIKAKLKVKIEDPNQQHMAPVPRLLLRSTSSVTSDILTEDQKYKTSSEYALIVRMLVLRKFNIKWQQNPPIDIIF